MAAKNTEPTEPTTTREPVFFVRPGDDADLEAFADGLASSIIDGVIELANAERAKRGLPPLEDD